MASSARDIIPQQKEGNQSNIIEKIKPKNEEQAKQIFNEAKKRLLSDSWKEISGDISASFTLTNAEGEKIERDAQTGDYFKIDIPGPGTKTGEGYDWVRIEAIEDYSTASAENESFGVRPAPNPHKNAGDKEAAHFFKDEATSNFLIEQKGTMVSAAVYGRNEKLNLTTEKLSDKVRNAVVGTTAVMGLSIIQWKKLAKGLIGKK